MHEFLNCLKTPINFSICAPPIEVLGVFCNLSIGKPALIDVTCPKFVPVLNEHHAMKVEEGGNGGMAS
jgi:hypothetical protein